MEIQCFPVQLLEPLSLLPGWRPCKFANRSVFDQRDLHLNVVISKPSISVDNPERSICHFVDYVFSLISRFFDIHKGRQSRKWDVRGILLEVAKLRLLCTKFCQLTTTSLNLSNFEDMFQSFVVSKKGESHNVHNYRYLSYKYIC